MKGRSVYLFAGALFAVTPASRLDTPHAQGLTQCVEKVIHSGDGSACTTYQVWSPAGPGGNPVDSRITVTVEYAEKGPDCQELQPGDAPTFECKITSIKAHETAVASSTVMWQKQ